MLKFLKGTVMTGVLIMFKVYQDLRVKKGFVW